LLVQGAPSQLSPTAATGRSARWTEAPGDSAGATQEAAGPEPTSMLSPLPTAHTRRRAIRSWSTKTISSGDRGGTGGAEAAGGGDAGEHVGKGNGAGGGAFFAVGGGRRGGVEVTEEVGCPVSVRTSATSLHTRSTNIWAPSSGGPAEDHTQHIRDRTRPPMWDCRRLGRGRGRGCSKNSKNLALSAELRRPEGIW